MPEPLNTYTSAADNSAELLKAKNRNDRSTFDIETYYHCDAGRLYQRDWTYGTSNPPQEDRLSEMILVSPP